MIAIIDYGAGNVRSVGAALDRLGAQYVITADKAKIAGADRVILPGVGEASSAMQALRDADLVEVIRALKQPVLGICIGMQLLCRSSEEGHADCIGIFDVKVAKLTTDGRLKVPHMGWDAISELRSPLFAKIPEGTFVYFIHSFAPQACLQAIAVTDYGVRFSAALNNGNFYGVQFHPEKSGAVGSTIIKNFLEL